MKILFDVIDIATSVNPAELVIHFGSITCVKLAWHFASYYLKATPCLSTITKPPVHPHKSVAMAIPGKLAPTADTPQSSTDGRSLLLKLPPELRNTIYRFALVSDANIDIHFPHFDESSLLMVCKQIRREASPIFYLENNFYLLVHNYDSTACLKWKEKIDVLVHRQEIPSALNYIGGSTRSAPSWRNLQEWLRRIHDGTVLFSINPPTQTASQDVVDLMLGGMFSMVVRMQSLPWVDVAKELQEQRVILAKLDPCWNQD